MERRNFISTLFATVAGEFAWLIGGSPRRGHAYDGINPTPPLPTGGLRHVRPDGAQFIKTINIGRNTVTCHDQATLDSWTEIQRQVEAFRIMREYGLSAELVMDDDGDFVHGWWDVAVPAGNSWHHFLGDDFWDDPAAALIAAEPLYLVWKSEQG